MDFLRKFIETAFCFYNCDLIGRVMNGNQPISNKELIINKNTFVSTMRRNHPEMSDDSINLIYRLFEDKWSKNPNNMVISQNLFYSLVHFTNAVLRTEVNGSPVIKFEQLFKWKEVTEVTGETVLICAFLAYKDCYCNKYCKTRHFDWANLLPTDNKWLYHIFKVYKLIDLHQHLKASTSVFGISWACLMNHISHRNQQFKILVGEDLSKNDYNAVTLAAKIRIEICRRIMQPWNDEVLYDINAEIDKMFFKGIECCRRETHYLINRYRIGNNRQKQVNEYDYAASDCGVMSVFEGERRFLYMAFRHIFSGDRLAISSLLYRYLLIKAKIRSKMVQINTNVGFANFAAFERKKEIFIEGYPEYANLLYVLPMYEARTYYYQDELETRIAPQSQYHTLRNRYNAIEKINRQRNSSIAEYRIIYHFIKKKEKRSKGVGLCRNYHVRAEIKRQASAIHKLLQKRERVLKFEHQFKGYIADRIVGIDAANSELFCRPEVFAQAFARLSSFKIGFTFHVGEDFYDIADGLRAIDEAILFLNLKRGDRLGHCLALGIQPQIYYSEHDYHLAIPYQVLIDDMVWLKMKSMEWNVAIPPRVEKQIMDIFNGASTGQSMSDYYAAMRLRKEDPHRIGDKSVAHKIYNDYHYNPDLRKRGEVVEDFIVYPEYVSFIEAIQHKMRECIERRQFVIECCPSSNVKIGRLKRFDQHPIFTFCSVKNGNNHNLPVTVNTDDLGIFYTSLPREFELLTLALLKKKNEDGSTLYSSQEVYDWIERIVRKAHAYCFSNN